MLCVADLLPWRVVVLGQVPPARPNTVVLFTATTAHLLPMPPISLHPEGWKELLSSYPDPIFSETLQRIARYGAKVSYEGPEQRIHWPNLVSAKDAPSVIDMDLQLNLQQGRVVEIQRLGPKFIISPLGLVPKPSGGYRRIHHLSAPPKFSVNDHMTSQYGQLNYVLFNEALDHVRKAGNGAILVKQDLADAFRHIPIHPSDWWLFGFEWQGKLFEERFLPFGLRTAPRIFNYFAEALHWILANRSSGAITHYLDDFLARFSAVDGERAQEYEDIFARTCQTLGLKIKISKNASGTTIEFLGLIIDTIKMEARLPKEKKDCGLVLITGLAAQKSCSLLDLQRVTGLLNFLAKVIPLGCTFCRRLYDLEQRFPPGGGKGVLRRIPSAVKKDLRWWRGLLPTHNGILIIQPYRCRWRLWTDAVGKKGNGGFILPGEGPHLTDFHEVTDYLSTRVQFSQRNEHINVKEVIVIFVAFRMWAP